MSFSLSRSRNWLGICTTKRYSCQRIKMSSFSITLSNRKRMDGARYGIHLNFYLPFDSIDVAIGNNMLVIFSTFFTTRSGSPPKLCSRRPLTCPWRRLQWQLKLLGLLGPAIHSSVSPWSPGYLQGITTNCSSIHFVICVI